MQRRWQVQPDETGTISRDALIVAMVDGATLLDIAGGVLSVVVGRAPTNLAGEMVMTGAVLEWRDRTDAKAQPESAVAVTPESPPAPEEEPEAKTWTPFDGTPEPDVDPEATAHAAVRNVDTDGFDYSALPDEDMEPAPEPAR